MQEQAGGERSWLVAPSLGMHVWMRAALTHPAPSRPHHHHLPCMQEQAGGERSWPAPPSIGMGYLRRVPVELKQRPRLVSVAAVTAFVVNADINSLTGGSGVGWKA